MELFGPRNSSSEVKVNVVNEESKSAVSRKRVLESSPVASAVDTDLAASDATNMLAYSFQELGLCDWICDSTKAVGYRHPTDIQRACIPAILQGRDVLACAETGSGKTAAFVLPMMQILSQDPYGIFSIILTPTRELAIQIAEQISALGSSLSVRVTLVIGGLNLTEQGIQLASRPHFVVATPGRLRHHLESSATPPNISRAKFIVLDEADRLLAAGFSSELEVILSKMSPKRQTLLFSATLTSTLEDLEKLALKDALRFDLTKHRQMPTTLRQTYLFMPAKVKICFLVAVLNKYMEINQEVEDDAPSKGKKSKSGKKSSSREKKQEQTSNAPKFDKSIIIFVESCHRCHEISEVLKALAIDCVALHSMLPQAARLTSLGKFKSLNSRILIATDVASRGLDIPTVDLVINFDLPRVCSDYVHRVGRTARAGRGGQSLSFVTQYDIQLLQTVEEHIGQKMTLFEDVSNDDIVPLLNTVSKAMHSVQLTMLDTDFQEKEATFKKRRLSQKKQLLRKKKAIKSAE